MTLECEHVILVLRNMLSLCISIVMTMKLTNVRTCWQYVEADCVCWNSSCWGWGGDIEELGLAGAVIAFCPGTWGNTRGFFSKHWMGYRDYHETREGSRLPCRVSRERCPAGFPGNPLDRPKYKQYPVCSSSPKDLHSGSAEGAGETFNGIVLIVLPNTEQTNVGSPLNL